MVTAEKAKLKSRAVYEGYHRAFARSYLRAMGLTDEDIAKPFVGVVSAWNETSPCNVHLNRLAALAKQGVKAAGGTPREFTTIAVTDGIAMGYEGMKASLISREVIADSIELVMMGHGYDGLVGIAGCDKTLPGIMMAMARLNVPSVFMYGGSILPGKYQGRDVTIQDVFESVGAVEAGLMTEEQQRELECAACPGDGACGGMFTANTMACASEALGLALPYSASIPAVFSGTRTEASRWAGSSVLRLIERDLKPRDILTREAFENAIAVVVAVGGSTNAVLHLPALAAECGMDLPIDDFDAIARRVPHIADLKPGGRFVQVDFHRAGGVPRVMKMLLDAGLIHGEAMTVTGKTVAENLEGLAFPDENEVILPLDRPLEPTGTMVILRGQHRARGLRDEDQQHPPRASQRPGARLRLRGRLLRGRFPPRHQARRRRRHPLRRPEGRPRHARDAPGHRRSRRPGPRSGSGAHHRRTFLRRDARLHGGSHRARSGCRAARSPSSTKVTPSQSIFPTVLSRWS